MNLKLTLALAASFAAFTSSSRRTGWVNGASVTVSGLVLASSRILAMASMKSSMASLVSVSVGNPPIFSGVQK